MKKNKRKASSIGRYENLVLLAARTAWNYNNRFRYLGTHASGGFERLHKPARAPRVDQYAGHHLALGRRAAHLPGSIAHDVGADSVSTITFVSQLVISKPL
jgi:hypothetical protein